MDRSERCQSWSCVLLSSGKTTMAPSPLLSIDFHPYCILGFPRPLHLCKGCTRYFSGKHRYYIFLTPMDLYNPCLLICHGALGGAGCCPVSYCLDLLTGLPGWTPDLTYYQPYPGCSAEPSPSLSWPCAGAWDCTLLGGTSLPVWGPPPWIPARFPRPTPVPPWSW